MVRSPINVAIVTCGAGSPAGAEVLKICKANTSKSACKFQVFDLTKTLIDRDKKVRLSHWDNGDIPAVQKCIIQQEAFPGQLEEIVDFVNGVAAEPKEWDDGTRHVDTMIVFTILISVTRVLPTACTHKRKCVARNM